MKEDAYKTIEKPSEETLFKEKGSKFFGYAFPIKAEDEVKELLELLQKKHHTARHFCYAYQLGVVQTKYRVNDDGEPNNSAGLPIYGQIQSFGVTNVLVVSVRYFGGTKLGVGGLISAYKNSAKLALEASEILERTINVNFELSFNYDLMNVVQRVIKENNISIISQQLEMDCKYIIEVRKNKAAAIFKILEAIYQLEVKLVKK